MNIFEKYLNNLDQNEQLSKTISKLCCAYLMSQNKYSESTRGKRAINFISWEFDDKFPPNIIIKYIEQDKNTKNEEWQTITIPYNDLLIKTDNYD